jgi:hypothetical protein
MNQPEQSQLGKTSAYVDQYDASLLFPIPRAVKREELGIQGAPIFFGACAGFAGVVAPLALALGVWAAVERFDGFAAVSGMTLFLVRVDEGMVTDSLIRRPVGSRPAQVRGTARSLCLP